ncbi:MAG: glycosyltransferase family 2 protein [Formosimonas sp.]
MIAVIVPCYNALATVERAVHSCLLQPEVSEIVLVDDASTDGTLGVLEGLAAQYAHVKLLRMPHNSGAAMARNWGALHCEADFLAFLDADDEYLPDAFGFAMRALEAHPILAALKLPCSFLGWPADVVEHPTFEGTSQILSNTFAGNLLIRREVFISVGMFPRDPVFRAQGGEDGAFMVVLRDFFMVGLIRGQAPAVGIHYHARSHGYRFFKIAQGGLEGAASTDLVPDSVLASRVYIEKMGQRLQALRALYRSEVETGFQPVWEREA